MKKLLILTLALLLLVSFSISCNKDEDEFNSDIPENSTPENSCKTIPVYEGMTISNEIPSAATMSISKLSAKKTVDQKDPFGKGDNGKHIKDEINEAFVGVDAPPADYYAKPEQDIYITVHVNNPDNFEIQSFTLNGVKYASYMFEKGSDMENLILKYNVGTTEGAQEYTLDAIKYIDGESIRDALLDGDKTVKVNVTPKDQPSVEISGEAIGFTDLTTTVNLTDKNSLISNSGGKLYIVLYDGEKLTVNKEITAGNTITLEDLIPDTIYQYAIIGVYDAIDGSGKIGHVLYQKAFATEAVLVFEFDVIARLGTFGAKWSDGYDGEKNLTSFALYNDSGKIRDLSVGTTKIEDLTVGDSVYMVAEYKIGDKTYTYTSEKVEVLSQNKSLVVSNGKIIGLDPTAKDTVLYLNMPISDSFSSGSDNTTVKEIYFLEGVTEIDCNFSRFKNLEKVVFVSDNNVTTILNNTFEGCKKLENITIGSSVTSIGGDAFAGCTGLTSITIPDSVTSIGTGAFEYCAGLTSVTIGNSVTNVGDFAFHQCAGLTSITIPDSVTSIEFSAFSNCKGLTSITIPDSVASIETGAFHQCTGLTSITFQGTKAEWKAISKEYGWNSDTGNYVVKCTDGDIAKADDN